MFRTPIINQNERFLDIDEEPLVNGKVEVLDPVSNNPLTIWSYSDDEYSVMTNPVRLDVEGRSPHTVFCDRIAYIRVYKYLGRDEYNQPMFEFVRDYYAGENENTESREYVVGMTALKNLDPSVNSSVNVLGYYQLGDCGMRTYVWDPNNTLDADNGYVVASNVEASGRWILQFDGPYIPSTYYGVDPQHISNAPALLSYVEQISGKRTAPGIYFVPGYYQNQTWWNTTKRVLISLNTQFDKGIDCAWIDVKGTPTTWIGDILVQDSSCPVHSCWYKSAKYFWNSGSRYKYADGKNWTDNTLTADSTQTKVHFYGADSALTTDTNGYKIKFDNCTFEGTGFLMSSMECVFIGGEFSDNYYLNASIDASKITMSTLSGQQPMIVPRHFKKPENVVKVMSKISTTLDLDGLYASGTSDCTAYTEIVNGTFESMTFGQNDSTLRTLKNVNVNNSLAYNGKTLQVINSSIRIQSVPNLTAIYVSDNSTIRNGWTLPQGLISCTDSTWQMDTAKVVQASFTDSVITGTVRSNNLELYHSQVTTGKIEIYPITVANPSSHYEFKFKAENSVFNTDVEFKNDSLWDIYFNVKIFNNTFNGTYGFTCPYWVDVTTSKRTICNKPTGTLGHIIKYEGNTGNCPQDRYYGHVDCTYTQYWYDWDAAWMRGMSNPSYAFKVYTVLSSKNNRYFLAENHYGLAMPGYDNDERTRGVGMRLGDDTNLAFARLVAMSELVEDSLDSDFNEWAESHGYTEMNDYFYRVMALPTDDADASHYDDNYKYYFW